jgi:hypothetical protein
MNESSNIYFVPIVSWDGSCSESLQQEAARALEEGRVLFFPNLTFEIRPREKQFLNPTILSGAKNVVFNIANVNPDGRPRSWRLGEPFEDAAKHFASALRPPCPGSAAALQLLRITRGRRTAYDHYMLQLHDQMKADLNYQRSSRQSHFDFPAGATWAVFTDQALHAATAGQHQLEQTFYLEVEDMVDSRRSPLRLLEKLMGSKLTK